MEINHLEKLIPTIANGMEPFIWDNNTAGIKLIDFWKWAYSDLLSNTVRGQLAEFIVASALDVAITPRSEWESIDLVTPNGLKIEIKTSAYLQSWYQKNYSKIMFDIEPKKSWDSETGEYGKHKIRSADIYVFCLFHHKEKQTANPLNLDQWTFYVLSTKLLDGVLPDCKSIGLKKLKELNPLIGSYSDLKSLIFSQMIL